MYKGIIFLLYTIIKCIMILQYLPVELYKNSPRNISSWLNFLEQFMFY
jgi:hypothetical protein